MIIIGLTGSIGMGKSTAANMLKGMKVPVHEADACVHRLLGLRGRAVKLIDEAFPGTVAKGAVDRKKLAYAVFGKPAKLRRLENILHPLVHEETAKWLREQYMLKAKLVVLDIPLLYEADREDGCDEVWVVSASAAIQKARVLARPGMTPAHFKAILRRQTPDALKRKRADVVIPTGDGLALTKVHLQKALRTAKKGTAYNEYWKKLA